MASQSTSPNNARGVNSRGQPWQAVWTTPAICVALVAMTFAVFGQTLSHPFIEYDDDIYIYNNPMVLPGLTWQGVIWAFTERHAYNWHPLTWISHMVDCQLYGQNPWGHHLGDVVLHAANAVALFLVFRSLTGALWRSAFVAAVFAIHPLRVESVAWISERKDVLSGLFFILTVWAYARFVRQRRRVLYVLSVVFFALGLMSKPMLVTVPLVLLVLDFWPLRRTDSIRRLVLEKLPFFALSAISCGLTIWAQSHIIRGFSRSLRLENCFVSCLTYLRQMIWPEGLGLFYPFPAHDFPAWELLLAGLVVAGISTVAWEQRAARPWLLAGWLWFLIMLLPVLGIVQAGLQSHADRYTYLPQIGIYWIIAWLAAEFRVPWILLAVAVAACMVCAWRQAGYWKDGETIWTHTIACTRDNEVAEYCFAVVLEHDGRIDDAITHYQRSIELNSGNELVHRRLAEAQRKKQEAEDAGHR